jgi:hypothetical protein
VTQKLALKIEGCEFDKAGDYLVQLWCDNLCIADVPLHLYEGETNEEAESDGTELK